MCSDRDDEKAKTVRTGCRWAVLLLALAVAGEVSAGTWHFKKLTQLGYASNGSATLSWEDPNNWEE